MTNLANSLATMRIAHRLMLTMGVMLAFLIIVVLIVFSSISNLQEQQQTFYDKNMTSTLELMRLRGNAIRMRAALFFMLLADSQAVHEKQKAEIADTVKNSQEILPKLTQRFKDDPQMSKSIGALNTAMNSFISEQQDELIPLIEQHQTDNAKMLIFGVQGNSLQQIIDLASKLGVDAHDKAEAELNLAKEFGQQIEGSVSCGQCDRRHTFSMGILLSRT